MSGDQRELRDFFTPQLGAGETLLACAYGVEPKSGAKRLAQYLTASASSWIAGALEADSGWGFATTADRLLIVRVRRVHRLFSGLKLVLGRPRSHAGTAGDLCATLERRDRELVATLTIDGERRRLLFGEMPGFPDNLRQARAIADFLTD